MECCNSYIDLGCQYKCELIDTGITAPATGIYKIRYRWLNTTLTREINFNAGEAIQLENVFNDSSYIEFEIFDVLGNSLTPNQCFKFNNNIQIAK